MAKKWTSLSGPITPTPPAPKIISPKTAGQRRYQKALDEGAIVLCSGPAGSGKTLMAAAHGFRLLLTGKVQKLILTRPMVNCGTGMGWLPGNIREKFEPYLRPLLDHLVDIVSSDEIRRRIDRGEIEMWPLETMRGSSHHRAVVILDEAQNATEAQLRMALTRHGKGAKTIVCGDASQTDLPGGINPFRSVLSKLRGAHPGIRLVELGPEDVLRSSLVKAVEERLGPPRGESVLPQSWYDFHCPACKALCWFNNGDESDQSVDDVEYVRCHSCLTCWRFCETEGVNGESLVKIPNADASLCDCTFERPGK